MHIPDGLMDPAVVAMGWIIAIPVIAWAFIKIRKDIDERTIPLMAILAAGIFVAQMLNFPIGGGTTGHLIGAALAVVLLGLYGGMVVMTTILTIQCLVFGDGGLTALGLNLLNMAVVAPIAAWTVLRLLDGRSGIAIPVSAWTSVFLAALLCGLELALSYSVSGGQFGIDGSISIPAMSIYHMVIATGEAIITAGVVLYLAKVAPEIVAKRGKGVEA